MRSVPPYSRGGTLSYKGATWAMRNFFIRTSFLQGGTPAPQTPSVVLSRREIQRPYQADSARFLPFSVAAPPAPHLPYPSSPRGRGGDKKEALFGLLPSLPRGERGRGSEGRRRVTLNRGRQRRDRRSTCIVRRRYDLFGTFPLPVPRLCRPRV